MFLCSDDGSTSQYLHYMTNEPVNVANIWPHQNNAKYKQIFLVTSNILLLYCEKFQCCSSQDIGLDVTIKKDIKMLSWLLAIVPWWACHVCITNVCYHVSRVGLHVMDEDDDGNDDDSRQAALLTDNYH